MGNNTGYFEVSVLGDSSVARAASAADTVSGKMDGEKLLEFLLTGTSAEDLIAALKDGENVFVEGTVRYVGAETLTSVYVEAFDGTGDDRVRVVNRRIPAILSGETKEFAFRLDGESLIRGGEILVELTGRDPSGDIVHKTVTLGGTTPDPDPTPDPYSGNGGGCDSGMSGALFLALLICALVPRYKKNRTGE
jgi:hypothetical protein